MTETVFADMMATPDKGFDAMAPENISPLVVWLGSVESQRHRPGVRGRGRHHPGRRGLGPRPPSRQGRAGIRPNWVLSSTNCSAEALAPPVPVYGA